MLFLYSISQARRCGDLHRLSQTHLIRENAVQVILVKAGHPLEPSDLVASQSWRAQEVRQLNIMVHGVGSIVELGSRGALTLSLSILSRDELRHAEVSIIHRSLELGDLQLLFEVL